jgi:3-hydroxyisobutyrate dehydrogenase
MGGAIASRVIDAGIPTVLWARRPEALAAFDGPDVAVAATPAELAAAVDLVGVCVWADDDVRAVLEGDDGVLAGCEPGTVVAIHSTVLPATCRDLARTAAERGAVVLDAPVSGGRTAALAGSLVVAVGGDDATVQRCRPVFELFGDPVVHLGPVGAGLFAKLVSNALLAANLAVADDALALGEALGIRPDALVEVLRRGSGRSFAVEVAMRARLSPETREQIRRPLEKDVAALTSAAPAACDEAPALTAAAAKAIARLAGP